jgi:hypothetical protein
MSYVDLLERNEILDRWYPYWFDWCGWCASPEGEPHADDCNWQRIRKEHNLSVAA